MVTFQDYPFTSNFLPLQNLNYHYIDEGKGDPLLFVHGNPTWSYYYRNLVSHFSKDYRCIAVDHIGCGLSSKPLQYNYTLSNHVDNLVELIEKLNLRNITLLVHDWGGAIGMGAATKLPDRFKKFVLFNTAAYQSTEIPARIGVCRIPWLGEIGVRQFNLFLLASFYMGTTNPSYFQGEIRKAYLYPYNNYRNRIAIHRFVKDIPLSNKDQSYEEICRIQDNLSLFDKHPVKIIWGKQDFCFNMNFFHRWAEIYPHAETHVFEDAGHYVVEDALQDIIPLLEEYINRKD